MNPRVRGAHLPAALAAICCLGLLASVGVAQEARARLLKPQGDTAPASMQLTLDQAKEMALRNNKLLNLAALNTESKAYAVQAARADYFPKISATAMYFHFNDDL